MMKICFMGTPSFASKALASLLHHKYHVACVYTKEPKKRGRGTSLSYTEVHKLALEHNIPCRTPKSLKKSVSEQEFFISQKFDLVVVASYGLILPESILQATKYGCFNIHASLLPRWRGASPIQSAIVAGDTSTGITIMAMDKGLDTGDIILQEAIPLSDTTTFTFLYEQLGDLGAKMILTTLQLLEKQQLVKIKQDDALATYAGLLKKEDGYLNFKETATNITRKINAFNPFPATIMNYKENIKVLTATPLAQAHSKECGTILSVNPLQIACMNSILQINILQRQGKKPLPAEEFIKGFPFVVGETISTPN